MNGLSADEQPQILLLLPLFTALPTCPQVQAQLCPCLTGIVLGNKIPHTNRTREYTESESSFSIWDDRMISGKWKGRT